MAQDPVSAVASWLNPKPALVHDGDDAAILSLFREWMAARRYALSLCMREPPDEEVTRKTWTRINELHRATIDTPAAGVVGLAIKTYLHIHDWDDGWREDGAALTRDSRQLRGLLEDAVRFVPELTPLAANALGAREDPA
jgi:hypothetical protein